MLTAQITLSNKDRLSLLRQARGIWKDRKNLPDLRNLRAEMDRFLGTPKFTEPRQRTLFGDTD